MVFFALFMLWAYNASEYSDPSLGKTSIFRPLLDRYAASIYPYPTQTYKTAHLSINFCASSEHLPGHADPYCPTVQLTSHPRSGPHYASSLTMPSETPIHIRIPDLDPHQHPRRPHDDGPPLRLHSVWTMVA